MNPLVLVTGGTGKTGRRLVSRLRESGVACRIAARGMRPNDRFDWTQPGTWARTLEGVTAAYLVAPALQQEVAPIMIGFLELALKRGVSRFVLLSASLLPAGGPAMGQVHLWLEQNAAQWAVLRPSWFMENFSEGHHLRSIGEEGRIYSATESGRVPFISADDIAAVAQVALTRQTSFNSDFVLTGGEPISYDEVAGCIGGAIGRAVSHHRISPDELAARHRSLGLPTLHAQTLAAMDTAIAAGMEDRVTYWVQELTGSHPVRFDDFVAAAAPKWTATP
jgi:ergot alkaloid biosynthesis protein